MAASRIKGITIEIGGDTTKLQTALKGVNTEIKSTQSQLKDVEKLLKLDPGNVKGTEMYVDGFKAKLENDTSYKGLWTVSVTLKEF
jgi:phage-related minor tail protein